MDPQVDKLVNRLRDKGVDTIDFFTKLPENAWEQEIYSDGMTWSIRDVLAHFVSAEDAILRLVKNVTGGGEGVPEDFDLDAYNDRKVAELEHETRENLLENFDANRQHTIQYVGSLSDADLDKVGRHPWLGMTSVSEMLKLMYRHNQIHQRDIRKSLAL